MNFTFAPITESHAEQIVTWRYDPPYDLYNASSTDLSAEIQAILDPINNYFALLNGDDLIGFRCFGSDARVAGGSYNDDALDMGGGLRPDLTGQGRGRAVLEAGLAWGRTRFDPPAFRVTVAAFNQRALRMCQSAGFLVTQQFERSVDQRRFLVLVRNERGA